MKTNRNDTRRYAALLCSAGLFAILFIFHADVRKGASDGVDVCVGTIVPSLFPMMILSSYVTLIGLPFGLKKILRFPMRALFGVSENAAECFILGGFCGYPVGVKTAVSLLREQRISPEEARRAALINVNPGAAFSVLVAGKTFFGSAAAGAQLYSSVTAANLLLGTVLRFTGKRKPVGIAAAGSGASPSEALVRSVSQASDGIFSVCAWITAFSAFSAPLARLAAGELIRPFLEVTAAAARCGETRAAAGCAFCLGFGGLCVLFQLLPDLKALSVSPLHYLAFRFCAGGIAFAIQRLMLRFVPGALPAFSCVTAAKQSASPFASYAALILLCIVFMSSVYSMFSPENASPGRKEKTL